MVKNFRFQNAVLLGMYAAEIYYLSMELLLLFDKHLYLVKCGKQLANRKLRKKAAKRNCTIGFKKLAEEMNRWETKKPVPLKLNLIELA